jgi:hypothetical protein
VGEYVAESAHAVAPHGFQAVEEDVHVAHGL